MRTNIPFHLKRTLKTWNPRIRELLQSAISGRSKRVNKKRSFPVHLTMLNHCPILDPSDTCLQTRTRASIQIQLPRIHHFKIHDAWIPRLLPLAQYRNTFVGVNTAKAIYLLMSALGQESGFFFKTVNRRMSAYCYHETCNLHLTYLRYAKITWTRSSH